MMDCFSLSTLFTVAIKKTKTCSRSPLFSKPSYGSFKVSCNAAADDDHKTYETSKLILPKTSVNMQNMDRRNLLLGFGGLYGAANFCSVSLALGFPITAPDNVRHCHDVTDTPVDSLRSVACCPTPPKGVDVIPKLYVLPHFPVCRIRPKAHEVTPEYIEKYKYAIRKMRELKDDDPWSLTQQAKIHCAYCNGAYTLEMNGHPELELRIHFSSLFYPFHRWYLYFYERILGKLIGDETFALPYWNWDHPNGMELPRMYETPRSNPDPIEYPLFNLYRNVSHLPPTIIDLYSGGDGTNDAMQIQDNLYIMQNQMINQAKYTDEFFGTDVSLFEEPIASPLETGAHSMVHFWTGDPYQENREDMGPFYSAAYDPIFFAHHANIDRMWKLWKDFNPEQEDPTSYDWLNASFVFYDENRELVRVYNKDCVDLKRMGYNYQDSEILWKDLPCTSLYKGSDVKVRSLGIEELAEPIVFPVKLDKRVTVRVKRPAIKRSKEDKKKEKEMLFLNKIKFDGNTFFKFDVLVNDVDDETTTTASASEFAGSFVAVPHGTNMIMTSRAAFRITELLEGIEADGDEYVHITLVPNAGASDVTISEIKIELVPIH